MNKLIASLTLLISSTVWAQNAGWYDPNARYGAGNPQQQQPQQGNNQAISDPSGSGNLVKDMNKSADKIDKTGQITEMLGTTATGVGASGLASCYFSGGSSAAAGNKYLKTLDNPENADTPENAESASEGNNCYTVWGLVTVAGIGLQLNGMDAQKKADQINQQACEISPQGCTGGNGWDSASGSDSGGAPQGLDSDIEDIVQSLPEGTGITYSPEDKSFNMPDGSSVPVSAATSGAAMNAALSMLSGPEAEKLKKINAKAKKLADQAKVVSMGIASAGGGGSGASNRKLVIEEDDSLDKLLAQMRNRGRKNQRVPASAAGKVSTYNGGPIGHKMDNLFDMIHRAYDKYTEMGYFYPPGTRLGPDGLPIQPGK